MDENREQSSFKSGFVGIIGRPNVGKSTLFNCIVGDKISIITDKPQTTRNRIAGIKNYPDAQLIFWDTPGMHKPKTLLNRVMVQTTQDAMDRVDILLMLAEAKGHPPLPDDFLWKSLKRVRVPVILAINKVDLIQKQFLLPLIDQYRVLYDFREIFPISALKGYGVAALLEAIKNMLPEGPKYYPDDMQTDATERFIASEFIREKITLFTRQEVPYATAVEVDFFKENEVQSLIHIHATIHVEKTSQKAIVIGEKGSMLKKIGTAARLEMEKFFGAKVFLELFVKVRKEWTTSAKWLKDFGILNR